MKLIHHGKGEYAPGSLVQSAKWPHFDLLLVQSGSFTFHTRFEAYHLKAGDAVLIPKGLRFHGKTGAAGGGLWVTHFLPGSARSESWLRHIPNSSFVVYQQAVHTEWARMLAQRITASYSNAALRDEVKQMLQLLLAELRRPNVFAHLSWELVLRNFLTANGWEKANIVTLAQAFGFSPSHFRAKFTHEVGISPGAFLKNLRLEQARELLMSSDWSIKQIAVHLGYGEIASFDHVFRATFGTTPTLFRKTHPKIT